MRGKKRVGGHREDLDLLDPVTGERKILMPTKTLESPGAWPVVAACDTAVHPNKRLRCYLEYYDTAQCYNQNFPLQTNLLHRHLFSQTHFDNSTAIESPCLIVLYLL